MNYIIEREKKFLLDMVWNNDSNTFQSDITFLPHYEELVKYEIKSLDISEELINTIVELYGEYSEDQPYGDDYYSSFYNQK